MSDPSVLLAHIVSQTRSNINFLIAQKQISEADGREIIAKLHPANDSISALSQQTQRLTLMPSETSPPNSSPSPSPNPVVPVRRGVPPPRRSMQVRAMWDWNSEGQVNRNGEQIIHPS
jgi:LAS seventeen-binding protein 1/2